MNHTGWVLSLTNTSHHTCYVNGYAKLTLENSKHKAIQTSTHEGSTYFVQDPGAHKVALKPGKKAVADLEYSHIRQQGTEYATYVSVTLPGEKGRQTVRLIDRYVFLGHLNVTAFASSIQF